MVIGRPMVLDIICAGLTVCVFTSSVRAQVPDHPIITEVYTDPPGVNDAPVGRDIINLHQEYIEIYLPTCAQLDGSLGLNCNALALTFYEIEGDNASSGAELVNYRFDLPLFDIDLTNGVLAGSIGRPSSGVVVLGWVDYFGDPPSDLAETPSTRVGLINGDIIEKPTNYVFIPINGHHFTGTTNFDLLAGESLIDLPNEARSGVIQNGSAAYLLVNPADSGSESFYGTADQGGNVWEWNEAVLGGSTRGLRGGSWNSVEGALRSSGRSDDAPSVESDVIGFRVASPFPVPAQVSFDWVTVGNAGNAADPLNDGVVPGIGSVADIYRIAKHEVTNALYAEFLNAVAATDTNSLYNTSMDSDPRGGITQSGSSGSFVYNVRDDMASKPVNYVSFFDAMRFANWLHNGKPAGAQDASTTESGVYGINDGVSETRTVDAQFFIPTEDEWYKAAYHQPSTEGGDSDDYWLYPTASNSVPAVAAANDTGDISNPGANVANYANGADWNSQTGNVTTVGTGGAGYVELCDDKHAGDCAAGADASLPNDSFGLATSALFDAFAGNDDSSFAIDDQPLSVCDDTPDNCDDLQTVLPEGGAFTPFVPQIPEKDTSNLTPTIGNGYARKYVNVLKTTENDFLDDDPFIDALDSYRLIRNNGPFFPTPGQVVFTTSPPELGLATDVELFLEVLSQTTGQLGLLAANVGGAFDIDIAVDCIAGCNQTDATFSSGPITTNVPGQSFAFPSIAVTGSPTATHLATAVVTARVTATNSFGGEPAVLNAIQTATVTATILNPVDGQNHNGGPLETTVFLAIQAVLEQPGVANEFVGTDVGAFLDAQPDITALETIGSGAFLLDPMTDLNNIVQMAGRIKEMPSLDDDKCIKWASAPGSVDGLNLAETIANSAEVLSGSSAYIGNVVFDINCGTLQDRVRAVRMNVPDMLVFGGSFSPSEAIHFADPQGLTGNERSGLSNATTTRTFELLLVDTNLNLFVGNIETGLTDDFGIVIEVLDTEDDALAKPGQLVFLSFSGGLQGTDIDPVVGKDGGVLLQLIFLDLDNLHTKLGIRSIEQLFVVDAGASGEIDLIEAFNLNPIDLAVPNLIATSPAANESLWRTNLNIARFTFSSNITAPASGDILIQKLQPSGGFGSDLSAGFEMTVENDINGNPRILKIVDTDLPDFIHRQWYSVRNTGGWAEVANFNVHYVVQVGDANNDGEVLDADANLINTVIPDFMAADDERRDIDGDGRVLNDDVGFGSAIIPSFTVSKPSGH